MNLDESLREILISYVSYAGIVSPVHTDKAIAKIKALYRKEIEEAIGEDENDQDDRFRDGQGNVTIGASSYVSGRNQLRQTLRAKLLQPTKGDNDER